MLKRERELDLDEGDEKDDEEEDVAERDGWEPKLSAT